MALVQQASGTQRQGWRATRRRFLRRWVWTRPSMALVQQASGTQRREARGASRGNARLGSKMQFPSACVSGFMAWAFCPQYG